VKGGDAQKGATEMWVFGSALFPLLRMGQAPRNKPKRLGEKLLQIREALGLSQKEMAKRLSQRTGFTITQTHVSNYERDRVEPFLETTLAYARLANVEMNEIADDDLDLSL
jgi:DNA-binding XRE family transcriptional regulator